MAAAVFRRVERLLAEREPGALQRRFIEGAPVLLTMAAASVGRVVVMGRQCAEVECFNLQAATRISASDRQGLERMARYLARPPIATDRLSQLEDGRLELR